MIYCTELGPILIDRHKPMEGAGLCSPQNHYGKWTYITGPWRDRLNGLVTDATSQAECLIGLRDTR